MGLRPPVKASVWVGSRSPILIFAIFTNMAKTEYRRSRSSLWIIRRSCPHLRLLTRSQPDSHFQHASCQQPRRFRVHCARCTSSGSCRCRSENISPAPVQPLARLGSAGIGQKNTFPEPAQLQAPNLITAALEITPSALAAQRGSIGVGTDNVPPTPTNPQVFFHCDAADVGSQASLAQPQATSREATANRAPVPVEPPALLRLPSISQARPPSLVPSDLISTRTRRCQAAGAGYSRPAVDYGFSRLNLAPPPAKQSVATV